MCKGSTVTDCIDCGDPSINHRYLTVKGECACIDGYGDVLSYYNPVNKVIPELACASIKINLFN